MSAYYDDLILGGIYEQPAVFGQNLNGYADDLIYVGALVGTPIPPITIPAPQASGLGSINKEYHIQFPREPRPKEALKFKRHTENLDRQDIADILATLKDNGII